MKQSIPVLVAVEAFNRQRQDVYDNMVEQLGGPPDEVAFVHVKEGEPFAGSADSILTAVWDALSITGYMWDRGPLYFYAGYEVKI